MIDCSFFCGGRCWFDGVVLAGEFRSGLDIRGGRVVSFFDFNTEYVTGTEHIAGEEDIFFVGAEANVGFGAVVVVGHVDKMLGFEDSGLPERRFVECAFADGDHMGVEEFDPFAVRCSGDLAGVAAVAGEEVEIFGEVEVN